MKKRCKTGWWYLIILMGWLCLVVNIGNLQAGTRILFLGDSLTAGLGVEITQAFPSLLETMLKEKGFEQLQIINGGISGSTTASALSRLKWYGTIQVDILVLALGGNDGLRGLPTDDMYQNLNEAVKFALARGMRVLLAGIEVPPNMGADYATSFRRVFYRLAKEHSLTFFPFLLQDVGGTPSLNLPDGIHPNTEGHRLIAKNMLPYLLQLLPHS